MTRLQKSSLTLRVAAMEGNRSHLPRTANVSGRFVFNLLSYAIGFSSPVKHRSFGDAAERSNFVSRLPTGERITPEILRTCFSTRY